ncbi:hypothetical protein GCM10009548_80980 [Streptomyces malaysiensis subsp. malaysiensis]|uniref:DUF4760 domain-containing protein n=1 Tax=Streptomyces malaysiensis TaxID=92644 RepID=A0ABX6W8E7_STRMQ|nr:MULTISPECIES: hypothetical protein [Streptomyces]QPI57753.1 hypothetical protein I1A49_25145 [Streptomyces solisilvae]UHH19314.1 hypothetical protein LUV23_25335 [Streptomyces sp. HNM0561]
MYVHHKYLGLLRRSSLQRADHDVTGLGAGRMPDNAGMDSTWGAALIALAGVFVGGGISLFGIMWQQRRSEETAEKNRRTSQREASLDSIKQVLFAILRHGDSVPNQHTPASEYLVWERTLKEHLTCIEMDALRLDDPDLRAAISEMGSLLNDWHELAPMAWPREVVNTATRHAIECVGAGLRGDALPSPGPAVQRLYEARMVRDEYEHTAEEEIRRAQQEQRRRDSGGESRTEP